MSIYLITFGLPRAGNKPFRNEMLHRADVIHSKVASWRIVYSRDPVARVPMRIRQMLRHVPREIWYPPEKYRTICPDSRKEDKKLQPENRVERDAYGGGVTVWRANTSMLCSRPCSNRTLSQADCSLTLDPHSAFVQSAPALQLVLWSTSRSHAIVTIPLFAKILWMKRRPTVKKRCRQTSLSAATTSTKAQHFPQNASLAITMTGSAPTQCPTKSDCAGCVCPLLISQQHELSWV